ncbi:terminase large subunit domain-containing protein [Magnetofaba australis]|uniref:Uncharacterized protein n=1 Tax=Magnetofaba australis IT-1 TaxID=1434232 RepID=A0A1Y2K7V5_9PROT|nr:terminase family protein [Magnetofaba australis]OSM06762.1 hypothetical protein MAIT1_00381 [Magnetofaba australis IT-1]
MTLPAMARDLRYALDPVAWAVERLQWEPDTWQRRFLLSASQRVILLCSRQVGKSTAAAALALHTAIFRPGSNTLLLSPSQRQSGELFRKISGFLKALPEQERPQLPEDNRLSLATASGSRVVSLPGSPDTIRGYSGVDLLVLDEAAFASDALYMAVLPMLAASGGRLVLLSTPQGKRGFFYREWADGGADWARIQVRASECPRISPAFLEQQRQTMGEAWFQQEYMAEFSDNLNAVFSHNAIQAAFCNDVDPLFPSGLEGFEGGAGDMFAVNPAFRT